MTSLQMRPSRSAIVRSQLSATVVSCVTMTTVEPRRVWRSRMSGEDLLTGSRVEVAGRFVGQQDRRVDRQRARDGDALALAAGELVGQMRPADCRAGRASSSFAARSSTFFAGQPRRCSGRPTFSRQVSVGSRLKNWKMKPILSRRTRVSSSSDNFAKDSPSTGPRRTSAGRARRPG